MAIRAKKAKKTTKAKKTAKKKAAKKTAKRKTKTVKKTTKKKTTKKRTKKIVPPDNGTTTDNGGSGGGSSTGGGSGNGGSANGGSPANAAIRIRMYRVGFGDFFLLSVRNKAGTFVHTLVDCGVHAADLGVIGTAIDQLATDTGKQLALVIMTHRHADHISGFARGKDVFADFTVERVWMPWFENQGDKKAVAFQQNLAAVASKLERQLALRAGPGDNKLQAMMSNISSVAAGGSNAVALDVLHKGFKNKPTKDETLVRYYKAGDTADLPQSLIDAGVSVQILGPPIDPSLIAQMDNKSHQYLSMSDDAQDEAPAAPFAPRFAASDTAYPHEAFSLFNAKEIQQTVADAQPDMLAARAQSADNNLNNQSLVTLFQVAGKKLLFAGDAQWGNWANFLFGGKVSASGQQALAADAKAILGSLDFYKVGHHGSTNATPIDALQAMRAGLVAMCSTEPGAYGSVANKSEVPRGPLIDALTERTQGKLAMSTEVAVTGKAAEGPLPSIFKAQNGAIDYYFP
jgi:beta-lactamase superfamily II metal-dependent hydrolase